MDYSCLAHICRPLYAPETAQGVPADTCKSLLSLVAPAIPLAEPVIPLAGLVGDPRWGLPGLPGGIDGEEARRARRYSHLLLAARQRQGGRDGFPPRFAGEQPAVHFLAGADARRAEDHLGRGRVIGELPAEVAGDPQRVTGVGQRGVRREAMEDDHVTRAVVRSRPARLGAGQRAGPLRWPVVAAWLDGQPAERDRDVHQRQPAGQHVLAAADRVVVVDEPAAGTLAGDLGVDGTEH